MSNEPRSTSTAWNRIFTAAGIVGGEALAIPLDDLSDKVGIELAGSDVVEKEQRSRQLRGKRRRRNG